MFSSPFLCLSFIGVTLFNELEWVNGVRGCKCQDDLTNDPNLGALPPRPREQGSQVPRNWQWEPVFVDDLSSNASGIRNQAARLFQLNTLYSFLFDHEKRARDEYEAKEQEHIRNKQIQYNENMKKQWKKDRMNSLPTRCIISRR